MKAMILAAGKGTRMMPLTRDTPKPLLTAGGRSLIEHQLLRLRDAGIHEVIVNTAYLGERISEALGDGAQLGMQIFYSPEPEPLETAGAINHALPLLGDEPFMLLNGDVWCDLDLTELSQYVLGAEPGSDLGRLVLVPNPEFKTQGDFSLSASSKLNYACAGADSFTYSGIALLSPALIKGYPKRRQIFALREVFDHAIESGQMSAQIYHGDWRDIGTPERLQQLRQDLQA